jgi:transaldolase
VDRPNLFVKIPATEAGLPAIAACLAEGISINVTLIFSRARYEAVMDAFLDGMERARAAGRELSTIASVASLFVSRLDTAVDEQLDRLGTTEAARLRGQAAIANARSVFAAYERLFTSARWKALAAAGARPQRPLWASTGVKDPAYEDTRYVDQLVTAGVVNTMPEATLNAVADHGNVAGDSVRINYPGAQQVLDDLAGLGVDLCDVTRRLEDIAVQAFKASWDSLAKALEEHLRRSGQHLEMSAEKP